MKRSYLFILMTHCNKISLILISLIIATFSPLSYSQTTPTATINNKPIAIDADNQQIDIKKNMITFSGHVIVIQEGLKVEADTVVITEMQNKDKQIITAYGKPVYFEQVVDNDSAQTITGHSDILTYNVNENSVTLTGNAELFQLDNQISGAVITYDVIQQTIKAQSDKGSRVKTTIIPNQVREINN